MDANNDLAPVWLLEQLLEEEVGVSQLLAGDPGCVGDQAIAPVEAAVVLLSQALDHHDRCCNCQSESCGCGSAQVHI